MKLQEHTLTITCSTMLYWKLVLFVFRSMLPLIKFPAVSVCSDMYMYIFAFYDISDVKQIGRRQGQTHVR